LPGLPKTPAADATPKKRRPKGRRRRWLRYLLVFCALMALGGAAASYYTYRSFAGLIDERLHGERERTLPRVYARPVELRRGQALSATELVVRLNDLGYAQRPHADRPGEFAVTRDTILLRPRSGEGKGKTIQVTFATPSGKRPANTPPPATTIRDLVIVGGGSTATVELDTPLLTALVAGGVREKRRHVPLASIPKHVQQAVMAIEDRSF
jgi:penicillin-binding protein 1B